MTTINIEKIVRETDKAILASVEVECSAGRRGRDIWFPKSQIEVNGNTMTVPAWLANAKLRDIFGGNAGQFWFN